MKQEIDKLLDNINGYPLDEKQRKVVTSNQILNRNTKTKRIRNTLHIIHKRSNKQLKKQIKRKLQLQHSMLHIS